ncbi:putative PurR-regulated permease PerM [Microcella putealis]|uniref:Putative PurR-regulated permease PerM n=1 Tax=Microcella putealis TaxID=337005 RepID=A0A4Q7LSX6_9MICO|nr:AI-2E family transporter [Microcella putealis]RZS57591.1 putative PurR-regulated permease PerM [Microcella putealis]TQM24658.1 putative PurR-regulated permease PerM [Microcella putealis]
MKIQNAFRLGLFGGLGAIAALFIGGALASLATILTYIGAALFLALGLDPLITWLEKRGWPRWSAILTVLTGVVGLFTGLVFALVPVIVEQSQRLIGQSARYLQTIESLDDFFESVQVFIPVEVLNVREAAESALAFLSDPANLAEIGGGVLSVGIGIATGVFGGLIILILTLFFASSLTSMKSALYRLVPASRREGFIRIAEQVSMAVGRYVVGQVTLALCNGVLSFAFLSIIGAQYPALFAFIAFLFSLVPLVGTLSGSTVIVLMQLLVNPESIATVIAAAIYYLVYMQVEAYLLSPNIMRRAVRVPGVVVVIAALAGGTLLGVLGALIAIPVAASILIIIDQVVVPRQDAA